MNTEVQTKINRLLQMQPSGALFFSSWMYENGISYELQRRYRETRWLTAFATGVMIRTGEKPTLYGALSCLNKQLNKKFYVCALSALELVGYSHYVPMGRQRIVVGCSHGDWFPRWIEKQNWGVDILKVSSACFDLQTGLTTRMQGEFEILLSAPERAFMECLHLAPKYYNLMDLYHVMEQLTTLRPDLLQSLLEQNVSIKVKRLFLYMAEKANHTWLEALDMSKISLGAGKRAVVRNGVLNTKYQIIIPEDLNNYE
jgi:hypothetical protein